LHPDLLRPLASLIKAAANLTQVVVVTHSKAMLESLGSTPVADADDDTALVEIPLYKALGETRIEGLGMLTAPPWDWGKR
jgi:predicted ATPase